MTTDSPNDKSAPSEARHVYGPRQIANLIPALVRPAFRGRAGGTAQVLADWEAIVGPAIAAVTTPQKLFSGTLAIGCSGPMAMELTHLSDQLIGRINAHMGKIVVTRLRFVQTLSRTATPVPKSFPLAKKAAREAVAGLPEGRLRDALETLGRTVLGRSKG